MTKSNPAVTLSMRISVNMRDQLAELSDMTGRTKSFLAAEAIKNYLATQSWQVKAIEAAVKEADSKDAKFIAHNKVVDWVNSWDTANELDMPE